MTTCHRYLAFPTGKTKIGGIIGDAVMGNFGGQNEESQKRVGCGMTRVWLEQVQRNTAIFDFAKKKKKKKEEEYIRNVQNCQKLSNISNHAWTNQQPLN